MSDEEDTAILLNSANKTIETSINKVPNEEYQCIPQKNLRKPLPKPNDNLTPLTSGNKNICVSMVAILAGIAFGCDMGIAKPIAPLIKNEFNLNCFEKDFVISIWFIGALIGGLTGGFLIDSFGRRWTMISTLVFLTFGATLSALANHYILLLVARIICGYSGSVSAVAHCIYMAEVSDSNKRGYNIMLYQLGTATGFLVSIIAAAIKNIDYQWRFSIGITAVPALAACIITIIFLQRSPPFLLYKRMANVSKTSSKKAWYTIFETLTIMAFLLILQQGTGKRQVLYYAPRLFALLGICSNVAEVTALISLGIVKVFSTMLSLIIVERCGRRTALITSATICMTTISLLSLLATTDRGDDNLDIVNTHCKNHHNEEAKIHNALPTGSPPPFPLLPTPLAIIAPSPETWTQIKASCETQNIIVSEGLTGGLRILAVITLLVYEAAYALGLGPVPLLNLTEVFPAAVRGKCISFVSIVIWITHIIATESVSAMAKSLTLAGSYLFYSFMCLITIFYVFLFIPETKGKSLHQVAQELQKSPLGIRICNNLRSLPLICHIQWIKRYDENVSNGQSTLI
ncbi:Solute carrier family 2, facilitated glucose transporter member 10 [Habropoda laboriosa]|uniref:Solute carrier family 2, facilitated glucose transporter member 10 n=1 Tax=Habropoda laboriosa TaxID=597456 RepID=A0A0L7QVG4_9HYME|nr:PREDICTED: solute carrier family 2, facilitated glucose transporter member 10-like [Habropoda laboriosa]KOC62549.1 Solute carrier family 2, facilitated glucose transporter member 10 [Habropoda laboriosa]